MRLAWLFPLIGLSACSGSDTPPAPHTTDTGTPGTTQDPFDVDGDGVPVPTDCDDNDPLTYPGGEERCDGKDNACDGDPEPTQWITIEGSGSTASLAEAIAGAEAGATLTLCPGTYAGAVVIDKPLQLVSLGSAADTFVDGGGAAAATIEVQTGPVTLSGLTIVGGGDSGVQVSGPGALWMFDAVVQDNVGRLGAGVSFGLDGGQLTDTLIQGNVSAGHGGGLYTHGAVSLARVTIEGNVAGEYGGGIAAGNASTLSLTDTLVTQNTAELGGGVFAFQGVSAEALGQTELNNNSATDSGGGLYLWASEWSGGTLSTNQAAGFGGGLYLLEGGVVQGLGIDHNVAEAGAGAVLRGEVTLGQLTVEDNTASATGGGLYLLEGTTQATDLIVARNQASTGGGLYLLDATLEGGIVEENEAENGGGAYVSGLGDTISSLSLTTLEDNTASNSGGGAYVAGDALLDQLSVRFNQSTERAGGLYITNGAEATLTSAELTHNVATQRGGAVYLNTGATGTFTDSTISQNQALRGAGFYIYGGSALSLESSTITANGDPTTISGGGARLTDGTLAVTGCDWGTDLLDNQPDDVYVDPVAAHYEGWSDASTFSCDNAGCSPLP